MNCDTTFLFLGIRLEGDAQLLLHMLTGRRCCMVIVMIVTLVMVVLSYYIIRITAAHVFFLPESPEPEALNAKPGDQDPRPPTVAP